MSGKVIAFPSRGDRAGNRAGNPETQAGHALVDRLGFEGAIRVACEILIDSAFAAAPGDKTTPSSLARLAVDLHAVVQGYGQALAAYHADPAAYRKAERAAQRKRRRSA